jgi:hypothetical protein
LFKNGRVVWGHVVQANPVLYAPGRTDSLAEIIYAEDERFDGNLSELSRVASELFALKGTQPNDPDLRKVADRLTDEMTRVHREPVPKAIGKSTYMVASTAMVHRPYVPGGCLNLPFFPILIDPPTRSTALLVHQRAWAPELIELWKSGGA